MKLLPTFITNLTIRRGTAQVAETGFPNKRSNRYETGIGWAANAVGKVTFSASLDIRAYRLLPSANMRYTEDAQNEATANILLNSATAQTAAVSEPIDYSLALADVWTDWIELDKSSSVPPLSALWFGLDADDSGANADTVFVETK